MRVEVDEGKSFHCPLLISVQTGHLVCSIELDYLLTVELTVE
jgi:hypothetical protein